MFRSCLSITRQIAMLASTMAYLSHNALSGDGRTSDSGCDANDLACLARQYHRRFSSKAYNSHSHSYKKSYKKQRSKSIYGITATRTFVGPEDYPPHEFAAYGVVAFPTLSTTATRKRYLAACQAYWATFVEASQSSVPFEQQMVTVWPVDSIYVAKEFVNTKNADVSSGCNKAVDEYSLKTGQLAIKQAAGALKSKFSGAGPYLLAWAPSSNKGANNVPVLVLDLSSAEEEEHFKYYFSKWRDDIQEDLSLWIELDGWSIEKARAKFRDFLDTAGVQLIKFITAGK